MSHRTDKRARLVRPLTLDWAGAVDKRDGRWITRMIATGASTKTYTCPGCNQPVPAGLAHVVAWPDTPPLGSSSGVEHRRHWHTPCWQRRA